METILVTGAAGFIGSQTSKSLLEAGYSVIGIDDLNDYYDPTLKAARLDWLKPYNKFTFYKQDFRDLEATRKIFAQHKIDRICHLGARAGVRASLDNPFIYEDTNVRGTLNLLELAKEFGIQYFVLASTSSVYGGNTKIPFAEIDPVDKPISPYAATKKACELLLHTYHHIYNIKGIVLRFFTVYGPWGRPDMALFKFTDAIMHDKPIQVYNKGNHRRDFTYVEDIVAGVTSALRQDYDYEIINLGNSHSEELMYFIECIEKELNKTAIREYLPMQAGDVEETYADISKAKELLGFEPKTRIETGVHNFIQWYKEYYKV